MIEKTITIDFFKAYRGLIEITQYDKDGVIFHFNLIGGSQPIDLTACDVVFYATKPSGAFVYNNCVVTDATAGKADYTVTSQTAAESGELECYIVVTKTGPVTVRSPKFAVRVNPSKDDSGAIESTSEFTDLEALTAMLTNFIPVYSLEQDENGLHLVNDEAAPDDGKFYGIVGGIKGFYPAWHPGNLDCENGSWTPALIGSTSGEASYTTQVGLYVKIGNLVHCSIRIVATVGTMIGDINLSGLPFVFGSMIYGGATMVALSGVTQTNATAAYIQPLSNQDYAWMRYAMSSSGALSFAANIAATDIGSQIELRGSLTYYS